MKVYKFIFIVGFLNLTIPFLGIPFVYKNYALLSLAALTIGYALIVRTVEKERQNNRIQSQKKQTEEVKKTIEEVVEMVEQKESVIVSDVIPKRRGRKAKVMVHEEIYE